MKLTLLRLTRLKEQASSCTGAPVTAWPMDSWQLWAIAGAVGPSLGRSPSPRRRSGGAIAGWKAMVLNPCLGWLMVGVGGLSRAVLLVG